MSERQMVSVDAKALRAVLVALNGPSHFIGELQATRSLHSLTGDNPIEILLADFNEAIQAKQGKE